MSISTKEVNKVPLFLRVLGREVEGGKWSAHCLETDIVGYGETFDAALKELFELTEMQISFAIYKNQRSLLDHPAPPEVIELYNAEHRVEMTQFNLSKPKRRNRVVTSMPFPNPSAKSEFALAQA